MSELETEETTPNHTSDRKNRAKRVSFSEIDPIVIESANQQPTQEDNSQTATVEEPQTRKWASRPRYSPLATRNKDYKTLVREREQEQRQREAARRETTDTEEYNEDDEIVVKEVPEVRVTKPIPEVPKPVEKPQEVPKEEPVDDSSSTWLLAGSIGFAVLAVVIFSISNRL